MVVSSVSEIVGEFVPEDQVDDNINIVADVYEQVGMLIDEGEFMATENVSLVAKQ